MLLVFLGSLKTPPFSPSSARNAFWISGLRQRLRRQTADWQLDLVELEGVRLRCQNANDRLCSVKMEAPPGFEPGMEVLQISQGSLSC